MAGIVIVTIVVALAAAAIAFAAGVAVGLGEAARRQARAEEMRLEEERRALEEAQHAPLSATVDGLRLATQALRLGVEVGKQGFGPVVAGSLRSLADLTDSDRPALRRVIADDGTVTLMFSDIEGSTALNQELGDEGWMRLLEEHNAAIRRLVRRHRGQVIKTLGDSFMVAFKRLPAAIASAVAIQQELSETEAGTTQAIRVRIGIHRGEVTKQGRDLFGLNVALAARVAAEANGGEILVSSAAWELARQDESVAFGAPRRVRLKGIAETETVYPVSWTVAAH
jgi:class 3 adenylate cyclase